ncbi:uncharacterized protein LOC111482920 isoform X1 [Cucurbita maxima]|uniref:Uncharacterized protein LOC111482920 isoform X1 n=2 Tax=Cucurbita maxima TaxID=3661 RepID=A0A6J1J9E4_CUCMA|nr:uncharacterized protein LOC111482920 isoform X1 [Cucurbita maxima]
MDPINASLQSSPSSDVPLIDEALDRLELCWFFDNLLTWRNPRMSTSRSDPCLSNVAHQVFDESPSPAANLCSSDLDGDVSLPNGGRVRRNLLRTPSLPSRMDLGGEGIREKGSCSRPLLEHDVLVETPGDNVCSSSLDMDVSIGNGGGKQRSLLRTPSLQSRVDREEGIRDKGSGSKPLSEHDVLVETPADNVCSSSLDMDVSIGNGGRKHRSLLRTPSLPSHVDQEEGIQEKGSGSRPLSEHDVLVESPADNACLSAMDINVSLGYGGGKCRSLLRMPSLPSRVEREQGIREKGNDSKPLIEHVLLQKPAKPPYVERKEEGTRSKESGSTRKSKSARKPRNGNLLRTPSLPPFIGREKEFGEKEAAARIRNSIQPNLSEFFPTRQEILEKNFSLPTCRIPTNSDRMWHQFLIQMRKRRSQSELESEELQGFKDLGFTFDKKDINPTVVDIIPGLREKKEEELDSERTRRPYLSEAWMLQNHLLPPIPKWDSRKSAEDMKQQIKFWARAVASNVH